MFSCLPQTEGFMEAGHNRVPLQNCQSLEVTATLQLTLLTNVEMPIYSIQT